MLLHMLPLKVPGSPDGSSNNSNTKDQRKLYGKSHMRGIETYLNQQAPCEAIYSKRQWHIPNH